MKIYYLNQPDWCKVYRILLSFFKVNISTILLLEAVTTHTDNPTQYKQKSNNDNNNDNSVNNYNIFIFIITINKLSIIIPD